MKAWLAGVLLLLATFVHADEAPPPMQVRVHQEPAGALVEGQTARIVVDMLTPDFFIEAPVLPALHMDGAYLSLSGETPGHLVETIDGATWSGVSRTYLFTPLVSGTVEIPAFDITAHIGAASTPVTVHTSPLTLQVEALNLPAGVTEALIASSVKLTQAVTPADRGLHVGDSVTRRIEITAEGAPAMMLPPTEFKPIDGLGLYPEPPITRDVVGNQGGFIGGSRSDVASYVIQHRGHYTLPPVTIRWMDSQSHTWRESSVPAVSFHAWWGAPAKPRFTLPGQGVMPTLLGWLSSDVGIAVMAIAALACLAWWFRAALARGLARFKAWRYRRRHSEAAAFAALRHQRHGPSAPALYAAIDVWVRRGAEEGGPSSLDAWCTHYGDASLQAQWHALQEALYGPPSAAASWSASQVIDGLAAARRRWKRSERRKRHAVALAPLNPL